MNVNEYSTIIHDAISFVNSKWCHNDVITFISLHFKILVKMSTEQWIGLQRPDYNSNARVIESHTLSLTMRMLLIKNCYSELIKWLCKLNVWESMGNN